MSGAESGAEGTAAAAESQQDEMTDKMTPEAAAAVRLDSLSRRMRGRIPALLATIGIPVSEGGSGVSLDYNIVGRMLACVVLEQDEKHAQKMRRFAERMARENEPIDRIVVAIAKQTRAIRRMRPILLLLPAHSTPEEMEHVGSRLLDTLERYWDEEDRDEPAAEAVEARAPSPEDRPS